MRCSLKTFFLSLSLLLGLTELTRIWWFSKEQTKEEKNHFLKWFPPDGAIDRHLSETRGGKALAYDRGFQLQLQRDHGSISTEIIYLEYDQGNDRALVDLFLHSPEICLPASGARFIREFDPHQFQIAGEELLVRQWLFENPVSGEPIHAFKTVWSRQPELFEGAALQKNFTKIRLRVAAARQEFSSSRLLLAVVTGASDEGKAWKVFQEDILTKLRQAPD